MSRFILPSEENILKKALIAYSEKLKDNYANAIASPKSYDIATRQGYHAELVATEYVFKLIEINSSKIIISKEL